jgi:hypothetical protein
VLIPSLVAFGVGGAVAVGCSSSSTPSPSGGSDAGASVDASAGDADHPADGSHDGPGPDALYACASPGSFGYPCHATATGPDPTDCTDPSYPQCFVGGQGSWCTKTCTTTADCTSASADAACPATSCNARGFCR